jgi:hypothetical protein
MTFLNRHDAALIDTTNAAIEDRRSAKSSLDLSTITNGDITTVIESKTYGAPGDVITFTLNSNNTDPPTLSENTTTKAVTINFKDNVSSTTNIETAINTSTLIKVKTTGVGANTTSGTHGPTHLYGGCDHRGFFGDMTYSLDRGDGAGVVPVWGDPVPTPHAVQVFADKFPINTVNGFSSVVAGTGASLTNTADATKGNYVSYSTGTTTTGSASRLLGGTTSPNTISWGSSSHRWRYEAVFRIPTLSNGTDTFLFLCGFTDSTTAEAVDGAYIKLDSNTDTEFQCVTSSNSTRTTTDSAVTAASGTWYRVVIQSTNDTSVDFYIVTEGTALPSTPTITNTTNIPTGTARATQFGVMVVKSAGTTARTAEISFQIGSFNRFAV